MESLSETHWDVLISGTGLQQSLLALALSRSGKRVLHVDKNDYYGGPDAALSLQEVEAWAKGLSDAAISSPFHNASIIRQPGENTSDIPDMRSSDLSFSRAYTLSLSPQLIYTRSEILPKLVSSKVYRQLEFQAVGSWWIYAPEEVASTQLAESSNEQLCQGQRGVLRRVPNGREDVFADKSSDLRAKRSLMKFLKFVKDYERQQDVWEKWAEKPFPDFLSVQFGLPLELHAPLLALTLSPRSPRSTLTSFALARIQRHLRSIGVFGPGFAAVLPKWGGGAEIAQVACRAGAVGGGVYVLGRAVEAIQCSDRLPTSRVDSHFKVLLQGGETVGAAWVAGSYDDLPTSQPSDPCDAAARSIAIVSSPLASLFPITAEGAPSPGGAVVIFPSGTLIHDLKIAEDVAPVYITAHSSDTGECPDGQCILYASTSNTGEVGYALLELAVKTLLESLDGRVLWYLQYSQRTFKEVETSPNIVLFPTPSLDLAFDDELLRRVERTWEKLSGEGSFLQFEEREGIGEDDD